MAMAAGALLLAGCVTVRPTGGAGSLSLAGEAAGELRAVVQAVEGGNTPDFAAARAALERTQVAAAVGAIEARRTGVELLARYAALGMALALCREGVDRLEARAGADPEGATALSAGLRISCIAPLTLLAAG